MKKLLYIIVILLCINALFWFKVYINSKPEARKMLRETVVDYQSSDSIYKYYGIYKQVFRKYNYSYVDSFIAKDIRIDAAHGIDYFINEYGDTVCINFIDYSGYPRRKE